MHFIPSSLERHNDALTRILMVAFAVMFSVLATTAIAVLAPECLEMAVIGDFALISFALFSS